jgi:hypothetical protein
MLAMAKITLTKSIRVPLIVAIGGTVAGQGVTLGPSMATYRPMLATELVEILQQLLGGAIPQHARVEHSPHQPPGGMGLALAWEEELPATTT